MEIPPELKETQKTPGPSIFLTMGSSGKADLIPLLAKALENFHGKVFLATAGRTPPMNFPSNFHINSYFPGDILCQSVDLVICNGGSGTAYQALKAGKPILGVCSNMDQMLMMREVQAAGAGILLRADSINPENVRNSIQRLLAEASFRTTAQKLATEFDLYDAPKRFREWIDAKLNR
jgi:UDP:flavonoid glycosyltransferase YjiC (YdhE family)